MKENENDSGNHFSFWRKTASAVLEYCIGLWSSRNGRMCFCGFGVLRAERLFFFFGTLLLPIPRAGR